MWLHSNVKQNRGWHIISRTVFRSPALWQVTHYIKHLSWILHSSYTMCKVNSLLYGRFQSESYISQLQQSPEIPATLLIMFTKHIRRRGSKLTGFLFQSRICHIANHSDGGSPCMIALWCGATVACTLQGCSQSDPIMFTYTWCIYLHLTANFRWN